MRPFKRPFVAPGVFLLLSCFLGILAAEAAHHHQPLESQDHCAFCAWQQTASQADSLPLPPPLPPLLAAGFLFFLSYTLPTPPPVPAAGRSPPPSA